jgi:hypothetical protein
VTKRQEQYDTRCQEIADARAAAVAEADKRCREAKRAARQTEAEALEQLGERPSLENLAVTA